MNLPATPGHISIGRKAPIIVPVALTTGQNMRVAAWAKASRGLCPSVILRSAYSTTMIAPSTRMPTASSIANMIMKFSVSPKPFRIMKAIRNEVATSRPERSPSAATMMIMTSTMARMIESDSEPSWSRMSVDSSNR